jgi:hypothetical protein
MIMPEVYYNRLSAEYVAFLRTSGNDANTPFVGSDTFDNDLISTNEWHCSPVMVAYAKYVALRCLIHTFAHEQTLAEEIKAPGQPKQRALSYKTQMDVRYSKVTYVGNNYPIHTYEVYIYDNQDAIAVLLVHRLGSGVCWESEWYSWNEDALGPNTVTQKIYGGVGGSRLDRSDIDPKEFLTTSGYEYYQSKLMNHENEDRTGNEVIETMESTAEDHGFIVEQIRIIDPVNQRIYEHKYRPMGLDQMTVAAPQEES